jgi:DNA modification methylase
MAKRTTKTRAPVSSKSKRPKSVSLLAQPAPQEWPAKAPLNTIVNKDCIKQMQSLPANSVDLVFADPPFNIGYEYDVYKDRQQTTEYLNWSRDWIDAVYRMLKPDGTFWLAIGDDYAAELKVLAQEIGFIPRSWVIWYYTFGVNCVSKFTRSHTHLFYFVKDPNRFTFIGADLENRFPSARQLVYSDSRGNPDGRLPDDTWILRPQEIPEAFTDLEDTWHVPRVNGTFKERAGFHGCQMPEQLLGRIIRLCSQPNEIVVDPFSGSATTLAVAKKLGRRYLGFDLSPDYVKRGLARLKKIKPGDALDGTPEPNMTNPSVWKTSAKLASKTRAKIVIEKPTGQVAKARPRPTTRPALVPQPERVLKVRPSARRSPKTQLKQTSLFS